MAEPLSADDHQAALDDLAQQLSAALSGTELVELPSAVWKPFKRPTDPESAISLRGLSKLFTGRDAANTLKLSPHTFVRIVSILLYSPISAAPHRLLYSFIAALRTWTDVEAILAALQSKKIRPLDKHVILKHNTTLRSDLAKAVLRFLGSFSAGNVAKHCAAQMLAITARRYPGSDDVALSPPDLLRLGRFIINDKDYVLRILVADAVRQLISNGANSKSFWTKDTAQLVVRDFPVAEKATSVWLLKIQDLLSEIDKEVGFRGIPHSVFRGKHGSYWKDDETSQEDEPVIDFIVVMSTQISCIIPRGRQGLHLVVCPVLNKGSMSVTSESNTDGALPAVKIEYPKDEGYRVVNGTKEVIRGLKLDFESAGQATTAAKVLIELQQDQEGQNQVDDNSQSVKKKSNATSARRSIALIDLSSSPQPLLDRTRYEESVGQPDTYPLSPSPLQQKADQSLAGVHPEKMADNRLEDPPSAAVRQSKSFQEKIRAASKNPTKDISQATAGRGSGRSDSHGLEGLQNIEDGDTDYSKPAAEKHKSSTPDGTNSLQPQQPLKRTTRPSGSMKKAPAETRKRDATQASQGVGEAADESTGRIKESGIRVAVAATGGSRKDGLHATASDPSAATSNKSQLTRLKRAKPQATASKKNVDWDEDTRDLQEYDIPSDEEPQSKKPKLSGKRPSEKALNNKGSKNGSSQRFQKPLAPTKTNSRATKGGPAKKNRAAHPVKPAAAPRRSQRITKTHAYDEPEESNIHASSDVQSSSDKENEPSGQQKQSKKTAFSKTGTSTTRVAPQVSMSEGDSHVQLQTAASDGIGGNAQNPIEFSDDSDLGVARRAPSSTLGKPASVAANTGPAQTTVNHQHEDESAEDSYPLSKEQVEAAAALSKESFADKVLGFAKSISANTETPRPDTPFGDKSKFVSSVNASRSANSKRDSRKEESKHSRAKPIEKAATSQTSASRGGRSRPSATSNRKQPSEKATTSAPQTDKQARDPTEQTEPSTNLGDSSREDDEPLNDATAESHPLQMEMPAEEQEPLGRSDTSLPEDSPADHSKAPGAARISGMVTDTLIDQAVELANEKRTSVTEADGEALIKKTRADQVLIAVPRSPSETSKHDSAKAVEQASTEKDLKHSSRTNLPYKTPTRNQVPSSKTASQAHQTAEDSPPNENAAQKTPMIHFDKNGPVNQGRRSAGPGLKHGSVSGHKMGSDILESPAASTRSSTPDEAVIPAEANKSGDESPQEQEQHDIPESQDADNQDNGMQHDSVKVVKAPADVVSNEDEGLVAQETELNPLDTHVEVAPEPQASSPQPEAEQQHIGSDSVVVYERESAEPLVDSSDAEENHSALSDADPSEENASDAGEGSSPGLEDTPSDGLQKRPEQLDSRVGSEPRASDQNNNNTLPSKQHPKVDTYTDKKIVQASRDPLGIGEMLDGKFPNSQQVIETDAFRKERGKDPMRKERVGEPVLSTTSRNPLQASSSSHRGQSTAPETAAVVKEAHQGSRPSPATRDRSIMPPPPRKAPATVVQTKPAAWPSAQSSEKSSKQPSVGRTASAGAGTTHNKSATARSSCFPIAAMKSPTFPQNPTTALASTPEPFHTTLAVQARHAKNFQHRSESPAESEAYSTEANDQTLVNEDEDDNSGNQADYQMPLYHKHFKSTKASDEYSSVAEEDDQGGAMDGDAAWATGVRSTHADLLGLVMKMTRDVLFHLGAEEDAIAAKEFEFKRGAEHITENVLKSWKQRLHHEADGLANSLNARRVSMGKDVAQRSLSNESQVPNEAELQKINSRWQKKDQALKDRLDQLDQLVQAL